MKDKMSIAAVKEGTDKLVGVLIMRIQEKSLYDIVIYLHTIKNNVVFSISIKLFSVMSDRKVINIVSALPYFIGFHGFDVNF